MSRSTSVTKEDFVFSDISLLAVHRQRVKFKATLYDNQLYRDTRIKFRDF